MLAQEEEERKQLLKRWNDQIRLWRQWVLRVPERAAAAANQLRAIDDPAAAPVLIQLLNERNEPPALRRIYLEALAKLPGAAITQELVKHALADADAQVREDAARWLAERGDPGAVMMLVRSLKKFAGEVTPIEENVAINQIARVLATLKSPEAIPVLIDVLVTRHKKAVSLGGGLNPTFSSGGGGGLSLGNASRTIVGDVENPAVRDALVALSGGANFGFDPAAWRRWYEEQYQPLPPTFDLRRDP
jgi:HEAT repeat protein